MDFKILSQSEYGKITLGDGEIRVAPKRTSADARFSLAFEFDTWEEDAYVFLPAAVYNGNKMPRVTDQRYPPIYTEAQLSKDITPITTNIPALDPDGGGSLTVTAGDLSVPCVGVYFPLQKTAFFLFTEQQCRGKNIGFTVTRGRVTLELPVMRESCYRLCRPYDPSWDSGISVTAGQPFSVRCALFTPPCASLSDFFSFFFKHRRAVVSDPPVKIDYPHSHFTAVEGHFNEHCFKDGRYGSASGRYQCGWTGGGMSTLPLYLYGTEKTRARVVATLDFIADHTTPAGFFAPNEMDGKIYGDGFDRPHLEKALLTRKNGDLLSYLFLQFEKIDPKPKWVASARACADAFVSLFKREGTFGQLIDYETGGILVGRTACGASVITALLRAAAFFGDGCYLETARAAGETYYREFTAKGCIYGGPGEALCAPDSESTYALLEAFTLLYERTREGKWLAYAKDTAHILASFVMPYAYRFPAGSEFSRLGINTVGAVFANAQNKHASPGFCTASGDALYRLYRQSGEVEYLRLLYDVVAFLPQCLSTKERPVCALYRHGDGSEEYVPMPSGYINERVNTSDWETPKRVGEVFLGSCWCESAFLLTYSEIIKTPAVMEALLSLEK